MPTEEWTDEEFDCQNEELLRRDPAFFDRLYAKPLLMPVLTLPLIGDADKFFAYFDEQGCAPPEVVIAHRSGP